MNTIKRRKAIWIRYVLRHDNMLRHAIEGRNGRKENKRKKENDVIRYDEEGKGR